MLHNTFPSKRRVTSLLIFSGLPSWDLQPSTVNVKSFYDNKYQTVKSFYGNKYQTINEY